eukprot:evm.model.scf_1807.2 EVM.evm.TU.scf_1807.2   scf_1807:17846-20082(-)
MASHRPTLSDDYSDVSSDASDVSSINELPATGVPLRYPSPEDLALEGVAYGQLTFPPRIAPQGFLPPTLPPPSVYPVPANLAPQEDSGVQYGKGDIETGRPAHTQVVIPRLPLDTLNRPGKGPLYQKDAKVPGPNRYLTGFMDKVARTGFLRRVLWIVTLQMAITSALCALLLFVGSAQEFLAGNTWIIWLSWMAMTGLIVWGKCTFNRMRRAPNNLIFLVVLTALLASSVSMVVGRFGSESLFLSVIVAFSLVFFLASITSMTQVDVTKWVHILMATFVFVFSATVLGAVWLNAVLGIVIAATGGMAFAMYVVFDVQSLLADTDKCLDPDECIVGASSIYLDIGGALTGCLSIFRKARK